MLFKLPLNILKCFSFKHQHFIYPRTGRDLRHSTVTKIQYGLLDHKHLGDLSTFTTTLNLSFLICKMETIYSFYYIHSIYYTTLYYAHTIILFVLST